MWPTVWKKWAEEKGFSPNILSHKVKKFDMNLKRLLTEKEGQFSCNEPHSLRVLVTSLEGHLILKNHSRCFSSNTPSNHVIPCKNLGIGHTCLAWVYLDDLLS